MLPRGCAPGQWRPDDRLRGRRRRVPIGLGLQTVIISIADVPIVRREEVRSWVMWFDEGWHGVIYISIITCSGRRRHRGARVSCFAHSNARVRPAATDARGRGASARGYSPTEAAAST